MTKFFPVVTKRDYIKTNNNIDWLWHLLEKRPFGFLTAMNGQVNQDIPKRYTTIYDCGAWGYRKEDVPPIDARLIYRQYKVLAYENDILCSPDHMVLNNDHKQSRMDFNKTQADIFINICEKEYVPMATIHGTTIDEKIEHADYLLGIGYKTLAIGGLAAKSRNTEYVNSTIKLIMNHVKEKNVYIHVFGISSPTYAPVMTENGVSSFDGSSYFMRALTKGIYMDRNLIQYSCKISNSDIPSCDCKSCVLVRDAGYDTREFGNGTKNIGRAIHNLNMLSIKLAELGVEFDE